MKPLPAPIATPVLDESGRFIEHMRDSQSGFSLVGVMTAVAIAGVLAIVVIPAFAGSVRDSNIDGEVAGVFGELRRAEAAQADELGRYLSTGTLETDTFPSSPGTYTVTELPASWQTLRVETAAEVECSYVVIAGGPSDNPGAIASDQFGYQKPEGRTWFYMLARCYDGETDKYFFSTDGDVTIRTLHIDPAPEAL